MSDLEHAKMILGAARRDLLALSGMANQQQFADEIFGFPAQQVVEKALKAWLSRADWNILAHTTSLYCSTC